MIGKAEAFRAIALHTKIQTAIWTLIRRDIDKYLPEEYHFLRWAIADSDIIIESSTEEAEVFSFFGHVWSSWTMSLESFEGQIPAEDVLAVMEELAS